MCKVARRKFSLSRISFRGTQGVGALGFSADVTLALQANVAVLHALQSQITVLEERLQERVRLHEDYALLTTVPGFRADAGDNEHAFENYIQPTAAAMSMAMKPAVLTRYLYRSEGFCERRRRVPHLDALDLTSAPFHAKSAAIINSLCYDADGRPFRNMLLQENYRQWGH